MAFRYGTYFGLGGGGLNSQRSNLSSNNRMRMNQMKKPSDSGGYLNVF